VAGTSPPDNELPNRVVDRDDLIREKHAEKFRGSGEADQQATDSWTKSGGDDLRQGLVKIEDHAHAAELEQNGAEHLKIR
jgi:hypothetical protein